MLYLYKKLLKVLLLNFDNIKRLRTRVCKSVGSGKIRNVILMKKIEKHCQRKRKFLRFLITD